MNNSSKQFGPYLYPIGFPLMLIPIIATVGQNFLYMKYLIGIFMILSIPVTYLLLKDKVSNPIYVFYILVGLYFNSSFIRICNEILSDIPFLFFVILSLYLIEKTERNNIVSLIFLGFVLFFTYLLRDIGIVLIPTLFVRDLICGQFRKPIGRKFVKVLIPYFIFGVFFIISYLLLPKGGENHYKMLDFSPYNIITRIYYYTGKI